MRYREQESGQIILLAGILLAIAFVLFSLQLSLVATIGQQAGRESRNPLLDDYLLIRRAISETVEAELTDVNDGDVDCPDPATEKENFDGRVRSFLVMLGEHSLNRGHSFVGTLVSSELTVPNQVSFIVGVYLTDGQSTIQDSITYTIACS